jgi:polysaccharide biosynthesis/export protein
LGAEAVNLPGGRCAFEEMDMRKVWGWVVVLGLAGALGGCGDYEDLPAATPESVGETPEYIIGPLDGLSVFVWRNPELSSGAIVRPDGRVTLPLVEDLQAAGRTPQQLAREIEEALGEYILDPIVTVSVGSFVGPFDQQIRIVGEASQPMAIPYRAEMTVLDVMIAVGGLTEFADGNRTALVRAIDGEQTKYRVRLDDLLQDGDITANVAVLPGDVIIIPESWF